MPSKFKSLTDRLYVLWLVAYVPLRKLRSLRFNKKGRKVWVNRNGRDGTQRRKDLSTQSLVKTSN